MKGNMDIFKTYIEEFQNYQRAVEEYQSVEVKAQRIMLKRDEIYLKRKDMFMKGFRFIEKSLRDVYSSITKTGDAELELYERIDPFSKGINYQVRPAGKSWKQLSKLSGGEKTLSSLALIFALHRYKPTPLYFMDEIDAALDFRNVGIVGEFIKNETKNA